MNKKQAPLRDRLKYLLDLRIPGFESTPLGAVSQYSPISIDTKLWYEKIHDTVLCRIGKRHTPVFRFGDGECMFSVGFRLGSPPPGASRLKHYGRAVVSAYVKHRQMWNFRSGSGDYGYELYSRREWKSARVRFIDHLRDIAESGLIGFNFVIQYGRPFCDRYMWSVCDWLDANDIRIDESNFFPCYFVYALLLGPDAPKLIGGRRVGVVTHLTRERKLRIETGLKGLGAADVGFVEISRQKGMLDRLNLAMFPWLPEVILIAAGVGAANVIAQLTPIGTVCVDAGFTLDCIANPQLKGTRVFTRADRDAVCLSI